MIKATSNSPPLRRIILLLLLMTGLFVLVWRLPLLPGLLGTSIMSLPMHIFTETFSITISTMVFGVAYASRAERPGAAVLLGCTLLVVGLLDFGHMLSFKGMPDFVTPAGPEKGLNFWLAARLLFALAMMAFVLLPCRSLASRRGRQWLLASGLLLAGIVYWLALYHQPLWPRTFIVGQGLTPFKIGTEFTIIAIMLVTAGLVFRQVRNPATPYDATSLFAALIITCLSELSFTVYADVTDIFNLMGHIYKIVAYTFIYKAVFVTNVSEPFQLLEQANEQILQTKKLYATLAELSPVGIFRTDADGACVYVNKCWSEISGLSRREALGDGWIKAIHPEDRELVSGVWARAIRDQQSFKAEFRFQRPDGTTTWVLGQSKVEFDNNGLLLGTVGSITDLDERKKTEALLMHSEERLQHILDGLDSLVYVADMKTYELLFMNKYGREIFGEGIGRKCWQVLQASQESPCSFCTNDKLVSINGVPTGVYVWEFQNTMDQQWYDCRDQAIPWPDGGDRMVRVEIATNITRRKQGEEELRKAKEDWERTFSAIDDIVTIQDVNHRILRANCRAGEVLGVQPEELVGRFCYEIFHGGDQPCAGCPALLTISDVETHTSEIVHERLNKTFSATSSPIYGPDNKLEHIVYIARDITEFKKLEKQLRQAQKMEAIGTLAGGIAHDFNNMLSPILGYSELLGELLPAGSKERAMIQDVKTAGLRATELVKQILTFSRQTEHERQPLQIHLVVKEALKLLRSSIPTTITFHQNVADCGLVMADPSQVHQIIMNLCTNAYQAMRETGGQLNVDLSVVELTARDFLEKLALVPGPYVRLIVRDTGCGIPKEIQEKIFDPYFTTKKQGEGTGLGLSVVHAIVQGHHGHITVYSEPGKGSEFHVYLPQVIMRDDGSAPLAWDGELQRGSGTILVIDDEEVLGRMLQQMLLSLGYEVEVCTSSTQAMETFQQNVARIDLVLTDMTMPVMNGAELTRWIKKLSPNTPVVICTGFSDILNKEKATQMGIDGYLTKPVSSRELAQTLHEVLAKKGDSVPVS